MTAPGLVFFEQEFSASEVMVLPDVSIKAHGLPNASASAWILVGTHYGGIDHHVCVVMIFGQQLEHVFEDLSGFSNRWMSCEMTSGIGSRIFCLAEKAMWGTAEDNRLFVEAVLSLARFTGAFWLLENDPPTV